MVSVIAACHYCDSCKGMEEQESRGGRGAVIARLA